MSKLPHLRVGTDGKAHRNQTVEDVRGERDFGFGHLRDYGKGRSVTIEWGYNQAVRDDGLFKLKVGKEEVLLSAEDILRFTRWA